MRKLNDKGYALVTVLLIAILLMGVAVMLLTLTNAGIKKNSARTDYVEAGELSDKGLEHITTLINKELQERIDSEMASGSIEGLLDEEFSELLNDVLSKYMCNPSDTTLGALETDDYDICISKIESSKNHPELSEVLKEVTFKSKGKTGDNAGREIETTVELGARELTEEQEGKPLEVVMVLDISGSMKREIKLDPVKAKERSVEIKHLLEYEGETVQIAPPELIYGNIGDVIREEQIEPVSGYTLINKIVPQTITNSHKVYELYYDNRFITDQTAVVQVNYVARKPNDIKNTEKFKVDGVEEVYLFGEPGEKFTAQPQVIPGYQLVNPTTNIEGEFSLNTKKVTFKYEHLETRVDYMRNAMSNFVYKIAESNADINLALVNYDKEPYLGKDFMKSLRDKEKHYNELDAYINGDLTVDKQNRRGNKLNNDKQLSSGYYNANVGSGTNIQGGFYKARQLLEKRDSENVLIMSLTDGSANRNYEVTRLEKKPFTIKLDNETAKQKAFMRQYKGYRGMDYNYDKLESGSSRRLISNNKELNIKDSSKVSSFGAVSEANLAYDNLKAQGKNVDIYTIGLDIGKDNDKEYVMLYSQTAGYFGAESGEINQVFDELAEEAITRAKNLITDISPPVVIDRK